MPVGAGSACWELIMLCHGLLFPHLRGVHKENGREWERRGEKGREGERRGEKGRERIYGS